MKKSLLPLLLLFAFSAAADPGLIRLRETVIDPSAASVQSVAEPACAPTASGKFQFIIQPALNFDVDDTELIESMGVEFTGFFPPNAYHVLATKEQLEDLKENFDLLYAGEYLPEYKTSSSSMKTMSAKAAPFSALIILSSASAFEEVKAFLGENGVTDCDLISETGALARATITEGLIAKLTALSSVVNVEEEPEYTLDNDVARTENLMNVAAANETGYTGKGVIVCIADSGFDSGDPKTIHPDFQGKNITGVVCSYNTSRTDWSDLNGHGTHVAGSVLGTGAQMEGRFAGTAPDADVYFICCGGEGSGIAAPGETDIKAAYQAGARIMSNSYGDGNNGTYNSGAQTWDRIFHKYSDFLALFSSGNRNTSIVTEDNSTISSAGTSKNVITVGASENYRPDVLTTYDEQNPGMPTTSVFYGDKIAYPAYGEQQGMMMYSSRGPAQDGRAKPDVCAPGTMVWSTESLYDSFNHGTRLSYYTAMSGTSMSTPLTAGTCADICQFLREQGFDPPSSALMKAVLINGTRSMGYGQYRNKSEIPLKYPNCVNGFGHVNLKESLTPSVGELFIFEDSLKNTGDEVTYTFARSSTNAVNITMAWNDIAGSVGAEISLVNDLDLTVSDGVKTYLPNSLRSGTDNVNVIEKFHADYFPASDCIEVTIKAANIMRGPQVFALVVSGMEEVVPEPSFAFLALLITLLLGRKTK